MRRSLTPLAVVAGLLAGLVPGAGNARAAVADRVSLVGLTDDSRLVSFASDTPGTVVTQAVTGLAEGESLLGIDFRPATGQLYGLGSLSRLYIIDRQTGTASKIGSGSFSPALSGTTFGFDFNPAVDLIRVVSDDDQSLRLSPMSGGSVATDSPVAYAAGDASSGDPTVTAVAYTNNFAGAGTTGLYAIDTDRDVVALVNPPNAGVLNTVGPLGLDATGASGFDIDVTPSGNTGLAALTVGATTRLYSIDLATGTATDQGVIGAGTLPLRGLAVAPAVGYWLAGSDGAAFNFGDADPLGPATPQNLAKPIVGTAASPSGEGYWLVASDGGVFNYGDARFFGSAGSIKLNRPIVGMSGYADGQGYWLVASDGGIFSYGAGAPRFFGSAGAVPLNKPIVGMATTPTGQGYWLVASDGGIFSYGDARFFGSTGAVTLNRPIVGMAATPTGRGYWLVASDGGIFSYGDARFFGSTGAITLNKPIVGMASTISGAGYWLVASDGGIFAFGDAPSLGSTADKSLGASIVGMAAT